MSHAYTTHRITAHGNDRMVLTDCETGQGIVEAVRDADVWRLKVDGQEKLAVPVGDKRHPTITAMNKLAYEHSGADWITIKEPHKIIDEDGNTIHIRDEQ